MSSGIFTDSSTEGGRKKEDLVSIIIPVYNTEDFLVDCIESVLQQTYKNIELILVNDGSTDLSLEIANNLASKDRRIKIIDKPNGGVSSARNAGIEVMHGEYVTFVDADDSIHPSYIENLILDVTRSSADIVTTPKHLLDSAFRTTFMEADIPIEPCYTTHSSKDALIALYNGKLEKGNNGCQLFSARLLKRNGIVYDTSMAIGEDFDFLARAIIAAKQVAVDNREIYFYRANPQSAVHQEFNIKHYDAIANMQRAGRALKNPSKELVAAMDNNLFVASASYGALMHDSRHKFPEEFAVIKNNIKKLRWNTLFSKDVKFKGRVRAIFLCFLGTNLGLIIIRKLIRI